MCRRIRRTRADLFACCSFRHGLRRATFLREEGFWFAQSKPVSPSGRDVAQRQRGLEPADMAFQICPDADLPACCSFRHGLRRATFLREEGFWFAQSNLSLPLGEMSRSDREGWLPL